jgi:hypothetical protein
MTSQDDAGLVQAFRAGDRDAFAALVRAHRPRLLRLATRALAGDKTSISDPSPRPDLEWRLGHEVMREGFARQRQGERWQAERRAGRDPGPPPIRLSGP